MRRYLVRFPAVFLFAVFLLTDCAHSAGLPPKSVILRYKFVPGQTLRYKIHTQTKSMVLTEQPAASLTLNIATDMVIRQTVQTVRATDGAATSVGQIEELHIFSNGKEIALDNIRLAEMKKPYTILALSSGKVLSFLMPGMSAAKEGTSITATSIAIPKRPLKIGDSWDSTISLPTSSKRITLSNTLLGFDHSHGAFHAIIQQKMTGMMKTVVTQDVITPMDLNGTVSGSGTYVFDIDTGTISSLVSTSEVGMTMTSKPLPGMAPGKMPKTVKIEMQSLTTISRIEDVTAKSR